MEHTRNEIMACLITHVYLFVRWAHCTSASLKVKKIVTNYIYF